MLAATPRNHHHEFGALMAAYLGAVRGWDVVYVGPDIPGDDLRMAADLAGADLIVLSVLRVPPPKELKELASELRALARRTTLWIGSPPGHPILRQLKNVRAFNRLEDLLGALDERRQVLASTAASLRSTP
jgi:methanogenic corrinoid protein MtbC1